jgi:hypothetical protein
MRARELKLKIDCFNHEIMDAPLRSTIDHTFVENIFRAESAAGAWRLRLALA